MKIDSMQLHSHNIGFSNVSDKDMQLRQQYLPALLLEMVAYLCAGDNTHTSSTQSLTCGHEEAEAAQGRVIGIVARTKWATQTPTSG